MKMLWIPQLWAASLVVLLMQSMLAAQDLTPGFQQYHNYDRYRYLPRLPEGPENATPFPDKPDEATGDPQFLVQKLNGLIILDHPDQVVESPDAVQDVSVRADSKLLHSVEFYKLASSHLGKPVSIRRLNELVREIILYYRRHNQPVVDVSIPANQEITGGVVQIVVTEARIGKICVKGPCYFDAQNLRDQIKLCPGCPLYESVLLREQRWLYRNPFRLVDIELSAGEDRGQTDVTFNVRDKRPIRVYSGYEDTGNQTTGLERTLYGVNWYNAFNKDDQAGYQYTASSDFDTFTAHSGYYSTALRNRDIWTIYASHAEFSAPLPGFLFANEGKIWQFLSRWYRELTPICGYEHGLTAGFDFKRINTGLRFGNVTVLDSDGDIDQFLLGYHGKKYEDSGSWFAGIDAYMSPGHLSGHNNNRDFQRIRPLATANYFYSRAYYERRWWLPSNLELMGRITGQLAEGNLLPTEQLGIGGYNSVRGYDINSVLGDSGLFVNCELRTKPTPLGLGYRYGLSDAFGCLEDEFTAHVFYDFGAAYLHSPLPIEVPDADLQSVGIGCRYTLQRRFSVRADYGWALADLPPLQPRQPRHRVHIGAIVSY